MNPDKGADGGSARHHPHDARTHGDTALDLLAATGIATLFLDRELRLTRFTPKVADLFDIRPTDRGRAISDLPHRLGYDRLRADAERVLERLTPVEREVEDAAGRCYLTRLLPHRSSSDQIAGVVITFVEITARRRAEQALEGSEENLARELESMEELHKLVARLLVSADLPEALHEVLAAAVSITGATRGTLQLLSDDGSALELAAQQGCDESFLVHFRRVGLDEGWASSRALSTRERVVVEDVRSDPAYAPYREVAAAAGYRAVHATPLLSRKGVRLGVLTTYRPEPHAPPERDRRLLDLYARQAAEFIEHVSAAEALREKTRDLEQEDRRRELFLAVLGHEIRNPLAAIDNAVELVRQGVRTPEDMHPMVAAHASQLKRLVEDLLNLSRLQRGKITLRREPVRLAEVVQRSVESARCGAQERGQRFVQRLDEELQVDGDPTRLEQLITNLLTNAVKFSEDGGEIEIDLEADGEHARLSIRDHGVGLEQHELREIFRPFAQAGSTREGLGIGLSLVKSLAELHEGTVEVASEGHGRGCCFRVRLPLLEGAPAAPQAAGDESDDAASLAGLRILIVDDVADTADTLGLLLEALGAEARCAYNGRDGLDAAREWRPQVLLVDIGLPDVVGHELARELRAEDGFAQALMVAVTGYGDERTHQEALGAGFDERLVKPFGVQVVRELLARHLPRLRGRRRPDSRPPPAAPEAE